MNFKRVYALGILLSSCMVLAAAHMASADDWPEWRGADRTDVSHESNLLTSWPSEGPRRIWLNDKVGVGYSGFAIVDGRLYTMGAIDNQSMMIALDADNGKLIWQTPLGKVYENDWGDGPRATPSVANGKVYGMNANGELFCVSADDGTVVWQQSMKDYGGKRPQWGYSESVLVDDGRVICTPGGNIGLAMALNADTGEMLWQSDEIAEDAHYSSFIRIEHEGQPQYVQLSKTLVFGLKPETGEVLWQYDWDGRVAVIPTPIYGDDCVYVSSGYSVGCELISIAKNEAKSIYKNKVMTNHHGGVIRVGTALYGFSDGKGWVCQDFATGEMIWNEKERLGKGTVACANGQLYCVDEVTGDVVLIDASPQGWQEHGRFRLDPQSTVRKPSGRIWTHPVISNGKLYLRDQDHLYCYDIAGQ